MADSFVGRLFEGAVERVEEWTGASLASPSVASRLEEAERETALWQNEAEDLAIRTMDYFGGRPQEMIPEKRKKVAQRARIAFLSDPLAGREIEMTADFVLAKGVPKPTSDETKVQRQIDRMWSNPTNEENFTSYGAQRALVADLKTQANVLVLEFENGGETVFGFLDHDSVRDVVTDPENERRVLYYLAEEKRLEWDVERHAPKLQPQWEDGKPKMRYYAHWRNVEVAERERKLRREDDTSDVAPLPVIPDKFMGQGKVFHVNVNRLGAMHFGVPPLYRHMRFLSAMNQFVEARVAMAQARASFIARRVVNGTPRQLMRQAGRLLSSVGELGTARIDDGSPIGPDSGRTPSELAAAGQQGPTPGGPVAPGSFLYENQGMKTEALNLSTGGSEATADGAVIRGQISAGAGYGQNLLGGEEGTLAGATVLELPQQMMNEGMQKVLDELFRWMVDRTLENAVRAGRLGGVGNKYGDRSLREFALYEYDCVEDFSDHTGIKLDYEFQMPFPGRRDPSKVSELVSSTLSDFDAEGINLPLRRAMLTFLLKQGYELPNADKIVDEALPEQAVNVGGVELPPQLAMLLRRAGGGDGGPQGGGGPMGQPDPQPSVNGEKRKPSQPKDVRGLGARALVASALLEVAGLSEFAPRTGGWLPPELRGPTDQFTGAIDELFVAAVQNPSRAAAASLAGNGNGNGTAD